MVIGGARIYRDDSFEDEKYLMEKHLVNTIEKLVIIVFYVVLFLIPSGLVSAETYYVSQSGNDNWSGTLREPNALATDGPLKSVTRINGMQFSSGDQILFRRGDTWQSPLVISRSDITISSYGTGNLPLFSMAEVINNWQPYRGNIYVANWAHDVVQLFADNNRVQIAHHPNTGFMYADADASSANSLVDNNLSDIGHNLIGAQVMMRARHWVWYGSQITGVDGNRLKFDATLPDKYHIDTNYGYILAEQLWMLDSPGEWYHDKNAGKIYVWLEDSDNPNHHLMEASRHDNGIYFDNAHNVVVNNIAVTKSKGTGVLFKNSNFATVKECEITQSGEYGIHGGYGTEGHKIIGNVVDGSVLGGIAYFWTKLIGNTIEKNRVTNTFSSLLFRTVDKYHFGWGAGIQISGGPNNVIRNNWVKNSGYSSLILSGENNRVERNILENSCLLLDDGGGIYINNTGHIISYNIIRNAIGNSEGTPSFFQKHRFTQAQGIYPDDRSGNVQISNNTIINSTLGIFLHNSQSNSVQNNTVYNARRNGMLISEDAIVGIPGLVKDNRVEGNYFHSISKNNTSLWLSGRLGLADFGTYDRNVYAHPYSFFAVRRTLVSDHNDFTLQQWQEYSGFDANSHDLEDFHVIKPFSIDSITGNTLLLNGEFSTDISSWSNGWSPDGTVETSWTAAGGMDGGCLSSHSSPKEKSGNNILTSSNHFQVQRDADYRIRFSLRATKSDSAAVIVRRSGNPNYDSLGFSQKVPVSTKKRTYEFVFKATDRYEEARIDFVSSLTPEITYYIDTVSLEPVKARYTAPMEDVILFVNELEVPKTINLRGRTYKDIYGEEVTGAIQLEPFTSVILVNSNKYSVPLPEQEREYEPGIPVLGTDSTVLNYMPGILSKKRE